MAMGKTIALTRQTFVGKVMSLLFNILSSFVIAFLPRSKYFFMAAVTICSDFRAPQNKVSHCFHCFPIYLPWHDGTRLLWWWFNHEVAPDSCDFMDSSPPGSSVLGILQARVLEKVAISFSRGSSPPRDWTHIACISYIGRQILYHWATREALPIAAVAIYHNFIIL